MRRLLVLLTALLFVVSCATKQKELENIAKDWCLTIRASQVIPVYPPREDVQPGDVFIVAAAMDVQASEYNNNGFLPLDQQIARIGSEHFVPYYINFYKASYLNTANCYTRICPQPANSPPSPPATSKFVWDLNAPVAAFPAYTFKVTKDGGAKLAFPIQGIPVAMGLLSSSSATGTVIIQDSYTYGLAVADAFRELDKWASSNRHLLSELQRSHERNLYLRVISRVYLAGGIYVNLQSDSSLDAKTQAGLPVDVKTVDITADIQQVVQDTASFGIVLTFDSKAKHAVALREKFLRPLVIGYLGFDVQILEGGELGMPLITQDVLLNRTETTINAAYSPMPIGQCMDEVESRSKKMNDLVDYIIKSSKDNRVQAVVKAHSAAYVDGADDAYHDFLDKLSDQKHMNLQRYLERECESYLQTIN